MPRVPLPDPSNTPPNVEALAQVSSSAACVVIAELEAAAVADLQRTDTVQPRQLILLETACWAEVHTENHGSEGRPYMPLSGALA